MNAKMDNLHVSAMMIVLAEPFPEKRVSWRKGAGNMLMAYIDARDVMKRLDDVQAAFGVIWQAEYLDPSDKIVICRIGLTIIDKTYWRANGAGDTGIEAEKGACSDAFKRAGVLWGIGRYLHALPKYKAGGATPAMPTWATPEGYRELPQVKKITDQLKKDTEE